MNWKQTAKLLVGPLIFVVCLVLAPSASSPDAVKTLGLAAWLVIWWIAEAVPIGATSLLPLILLPAIGIGTIDKVAANYGDPVIFLFMGGFIIAIAMEKWNLHRRIALSILKVTGTNANGIVMGFLIATAFISMLISNTATTVMMLPIGMSVIKLVQLTLAEETAAQKGFKNFSSSIMIGIAFSASVGGMGTIIGTPPNMVMVGFMKKLQNFDMPFVQWMYIGIPLVVLMITFLYLILTRWLMKNNLGNLGNTETLIKNEITALGPVSFEQKAVGVVFLFTVVLWVSRLYINRLAGMEILHDTTIALIGGLLFFMIPSRNKEKSPFIISWDDVQKLPWKILLLFGGGIALAEGVESVGIIKTVGDWVCSIENLDPFLLLTLLAALGVFMSEIMGNIALATIYIPVAMGIGESLGQSPVQFAIPVALATSMGFMMPIATPPNAIAYGSGYIKTRDMVRVGFFLNMFGILLLYILSRYFLQWLF